MRHPVRLTPDQLTYAGGYISGCYGEKGYIVDGIEIARHRAIFHVLHPEDGERFAFEVDPYGHITEMKEATV